MNPINPLTLFLAAVFTNNILLTNFLGLCPFLAISKGRKPALGMGAAVVFVMASTTAINNLIHFKILVPLGLEHFRYIVFIIVIAAFVQLVEMTVERFFPALYSVLGIFLPLITVNCAIFGATLFMVIREYNLIQSLAYGAGSGAGWLLAILAISAIREKIEKSGKLPKGLEGPAITLIVTGLLSLAFLAFSGMIRVV
jgi:Na+-transporting NADH:ubiquinone oxidoreductase subunit E